MFQKLTYEILVLIIKKVLNCSFEVALQNLALRAVSYNNIQIPVAVTFAKTNLSVYLLTQMLGAHCGWTQID